MDQTTPQDLTAEEATEPSCSALEVLVGSRVILIHESPDTYDPTTGRALTGSWLWDCSLYLAHWIATDPRPHLAGKIVLELGAGTGLPGLAAAALGARRVVLTDLPPLLPALRRNVEANGFEGRVEVRELRWGSGDDLGGLFDVVLLSDVLYDVSEMAGMAETLRRVCREGAEVWAAAEVRDGVEDCLRELAAEGFGVEEVAEGRRALRKDPVEISTFRVFSLQLPEQIDWADDIMDHGSL